MDNLVAMETLFPWQQASCDISQLYESILSLCLAQLFLGQNALLVYTMETLLLWQQPNCAIILFYESTLSSYLAGVLLGTKHIIGELSGYGSTVTMALKDCALTL